MSTPRTRVSRRPVHGVLLLDKPLGMSSNEALQKAKWLLRAQKAGHTGTLDPLATGLLPLCFGAATKFSHMQLEASKTYEAKVRLGSTTTTGDAEGEMVLRREVNVSEDLLNATLKRFVGSIEQIPPMHSALKVQGRPLYDYARAGIEVERQSRRVQIHALTRMPRDGSANSDEIGVIVSCSKGTYVRTLAEDLGEALGCGAHLSALRRTASGSFGIQDCVSLETLQDMQESERLRCLLPTDSLLRGIPRIDLSADESGRFLSGLRRRGDWPDCPLVAVYASEPANLLGSGRVSGGELIPARLLNPIEISQSTLETSTTE